MNNLIKVTLLALAFSSTSVFAEKQNRFAKLDTNNDGYISKEEAKGKLATNFDTIDADGDGLLTKDELKQALKKARRNG